MVKVIKDIVFAFIEKWSSRINVWAWDKRWKERKHITQKDWVKGYKEWKNQSNK